MNENSCRYNLKLNGKEQVLASDIPHCKIVVPVSGGKDSQACLKMAIEEYGVDQVIGLFCDTKWEHPLTYKHVKSLSKTYGINIYWINAGSVEGLVKKKGYFPSNARRYCTRDLKIVPSKWFYADLSNAYGFGFEVWLGMRADESQKRKNKYADFSGSEFYLPNDVFGDFPKYLGKRGVKFRLPIVNWSTKRVFTYLMGLENPLYAMGSERVGCFPCLASSSKKHQNDFNMGDFGDRQKQRIIKLEVIIDKKHAPARTEQMCMFCQM